MDPSKKILQGVCDTIRPLAVLDIALQSHLRISFLTEVCQFRKEKMRGKEGLQICAKDESCSVHEVFSVIKYLRVFVSQCSLTSWNVDAVR